MAATWNVELMEEVGEHIGEDGLWAGYSGLYGPAMNTHRTAYAGRNFEYYSEDGTWTVTDGALVLEMGNYTAAIAENAEGGLDITVNYGQMGEKTYTMTADQAKAILN